MAHRYGGPWSEIKLDAVEYYLKCYTKALSAAGMDLWYIDAFAGSGDREVEVEIGGLLEGKPSAVVLETLDGSARRALSVDPPFRHFIFIEKDPERVSALAAVRDHWPDADIDIRPGEANSELCNIITRSPWTKKAKSWSRGVVFLDPYALQVDWETLCALARTECLDVWYLFNVAAVIRQLAHDLSGVGNKAPKLDKTLSPKWRELYALEPEAVPQTDMLAILEGAPLEPASKRVASKHQIDGWFKGLLLAEFPYVSDPLPIFTPHGGHTFSMFLCVANPSTKATDLADDFVRYVNRRFGPQASRRTSAR